VPPKIRKLTFDELIEHYPHYAWFDFEKDEIAIPSMEDLWKRVYLHEYIHWLRRDKWTVKFLSLVPYLLPVILGLIIASFVPLLELIATPILIGIVIALLYSYWLEEYHVQKKMLPKLCKEEGIWEGK